MKLQIERMSEKGWWKASGFEHDDVWDDDIANEYKQQADTYGRAVRAINEHGIVVWEYWPDAS